MIRLYAPQDYRGESSVLALGMFDGVHIGHQKLIRTAVSEARAIGADAVVCTFDVHPLALLRPNAAPKPLLTAEENLGKFERLGADAALVLPFTRAFAEMSAEDFLRRLVSGMRAKVLVCGENYTFGAGGKGNADLLRYLAPLYGYRAVVVPPVKDAGETVSSTRIRALLQRGEHAKAERLMNIDPKA